MAWPKETFQAVFLAAWNDMHMQMRHTLTDTIIDGDKGSFRCHGDLHGLRQRLRVAKKVTNHGDGQVG